MNKFKRKYLNYLIITFLIYFLILIKFINPYTLFILFVSLLIFYNLNKKLFKKLAYKIIFKSKKII